MAEKRIADDWFAEYKIRPVLMETFVNRGCYKGTIYKAANWVQVGISAGRRDNQPKAIYLRPLEKKWKSILNKSTAKVTPNDPYKDGDDSWGKKGVGQIKY